MTGGERGLYELLISEGLDARLKQLDGRLTLAREDLRPAEAADRIAQHVARALERALSDVKESERAATGIELARLLLTHVQSTLTGYEAVADLPVIEASVLRAILQRLPPRASASA